MTKNPKKNKEEKDSKGWRQSADRSKEKQEWGPKTVTKFGNHLRYFFSAFPVRLAAIICSGALLLAVVVGAKADHDRSRVQPKSFETYRRDTLEWLERHRVFQSQDKASELAWNAPREWRLQGRPSKVYYWFMDWVAHLGLSMT